MRSTSSPLFRHCSIILIDCWGSCLPKKLIITLNKQLLEAPRNCIEYVVVHELCHLVHPNHSKQFYTFLTMFMPDWKERKTELEKNCILWL